MSWLYILRLQHVRDRVDLFILFNAASAVACVGFISGALIYYLFIYQCKKKQLSHSRPRVLMREQYNGPCVALCALYECITAFEAKCRRQRPEAASPRYLPASGVQP